MISFYPGPSKVYEQVPQFVSEAYADGVLSINHRSEEFVEISKRTVEILKSKLNIPKDYTIFFVGSATECWQIIAQSLIKEKSLHYFNGAFGQKWFGYTEKIVSKAESKPFEIETELVPERLNTDLICITQNETSNGTAVENQIIKEIKNSNPEAILAVDATSSMGGVELNFENADVWFASVQKCFGLPAGMALMFCSPRAIERALELKRNSHYNSMVFMIEKMKNFQTTYTPNVLNIYLLMRTLEVRDNIIHIDKQSKDRYTSWIEFIKGLNGFKHLVSNDEVHSTTVLPISSAEHVILSLKQKVKEAGFLLGNGYGQWASNTFRIANFPAINNNEINGLKSFLKETIK